MNKFIAFISTLGIALAPKAFAAADAAMASSTNQIAGAIKENVIAGLTSATVLTALAVVIALVVVIRLVMRLFKRGAR